MELEQEQEQSPTLLMNRKERGKDYQPSSVLPAVKNLVIVWLPSVFEYIRYLLKSKWIIITPR